MKRVDKINSLIDNNDFCEGLGLGNKNEQFKREYIEGFKDKEIDLFYYEFVDPQ